MATAEGAATLDLSRSVYSIRDAAGILRIPSSTLKRWLEGHTRKGEFYGPLLRPEPTGSDLVSWGEFIQAGFLREYRKVGPSFQRLRILFDELRSETNEPYPLATEQPYYDPLYFDLYRRFEESGGPRVLGRVRRGSREQGTQLVFAEPVLGFLAKVEFDDEIARRYFPLKKEGMVVADPEYSFGLTTVEGIRTERIVEAHLAGESVAEIAASWVLTQFQVEQALRWEHQLLAA
jgi:uncharacterized protein (DUF433 family)